jgi:hypothetical protein
MMNELEIYLSLSMFSSGQLDYYKVGKEPRSRSGSSAVIKAA